MDPLSDAVKKSGADAYVAYASSRDADMRYLTHFTTSDPFVFFKKPGRAGSNYCVPDGDRTRIT